MKMVVVNSITLTLIQQKQVIMSMWEFYSINKMNSIRFNLN